jgi:DNA-binding transcriptional MerR regulator
MEEYKTGKVAAWVQPSQHENTIRTWSEKFAPYLSKNANATRRRYTHDDVRVLATVAKYRQEGLSFEAIETALKDGHRLADEEMPQEPDIEDNEARAAVSIVRIPEAQYILDLERLRDVIKLRESELQEAREQLASERVDKAKLQEKINQLEREIGIAQGELKNINKERFPAVYWLVIIAVVLVIAVAAFYFLARPA